MTFQEHHAAYTALVEAALRGYFTSEIPELLRESMGYSLFAGGKRLRPCMALAACAMLGGHSEDAMPFACALEMIHTYSLIHDDLPAMDNDDLRRGKPTNHKVFGEGQAILAGDGLLSYAMEIMLDKLINSPTPQYIRAAQAVSHGAGIFGMVHGQCLDLQLEGRGQVDEALLHTIHKGKTAAMLKASVLAGAHCANTGAAQLAGLHAFGTAYGLLFQITDDILDVEGHEQALGKTIGKDAYAGKLTFPSIYGLDGARAHAEAAANDAIRALQIFGDSAEYFQLLVTYTVTRKS